MENLVKKGLGLYSDKIYSDNGNPSQKGLYRPLLILACQKGFFQRAKHTVVLVTKVDDNDTIWRPAVVDPGQVILTKLALLMPTMIPSLTEEQRLLSFMGQGDILLELLRDSVRRMMKRLGTKRLWSQYSLKGRKGKKAFQNLVICRVLIKACLKNNGKTKEMEVEEAISDTLKYAPNQRGGIKNKVPEQRKKEILSGVDDETNSDS